MTVFAEERRVQWHFEVCRCWCRCCALPQDLSVSTRCPTIFSGGDQLFDSRTYAGSAWANDLLIDAR